MIDANASTDSLSTSFFHFILSVIKSIVNEGSSAIRERSIQMKPQILDLAFKRNCLDFGFKDLLEKRNQSAFSASLGFILHHLETRESQFHYI